LCLVRTKQNMHMLRHNHIRPHGNVERPARCFQGLQYPAACSVPRQEWPSLNARIRYKMGMPRLVPGFSRLPNGRLRHIMRIPLLKSSGTLAHRLARSRRVSREVQPLP
jgi:hypothetical protein